MHIGIPTHLNICKLANLYIFILFYNNISRLSYLQSWYFNSCQSIYLHNYINTSCIPLFLHYCIHTCLYTCILACSKNCILIWWHAHLVTSLHICILGNRHIQHSTLIFLHISILSQFHTFTLAYLYSFQHACFRICILAYLCTCIFTNL